MMSSRNSIVSQNTKRQNREVSKSKHRTVNKINHPGTIGKWTCNFHFVRSTNQSYLFYAQYAIDFGLHRRGDPTMNFK